MTGGHLTQEQIRPMIAAERTELADLLAGLPEAAWDSPTLCAGWRVREVVSHMTMAYRYSMLRVVFGIAKAGGNFNRMADRAARKDAAELTSGQLVASLRENVDHPWKPPGGGYEGALSHDVIHGLDITTALGLDRTVPADRLRVVLGDLSTKNLKYFGTDLHGVELRATDLDFAIGSGTPVTGHAQDILLTLCGRKLPHDRLLGEQAPRFTQRFNGKD
ncbi:maleylpyruvate isomerase family mycothiol-dependent enzyme [Rhodococcus oryzae]|uniref:Maleylpyruvate isomerase family mycothiol-dependent enzyme n=1 Tax=Rhodococcus oryzae TaxID=2571143 RepID=A0ABY2RNU9_9NOCA|nr:maleylpyruvate isomerase family mycothiol-dependent enzyme [Rhodococcus oryzae]TJZ80147.1 maleylpyruvate isomerase family mycothiol-dependent enzyme [Rhodococcus oryzae]